MFNGNTYYTRYVNNSFRPFYRFNPTFRTFFKNNYMNNNYSNANIKNSNNEPNNEIKTDDQQKNNDNISEGNVLGSTENSKNSENDRHTKGVHFGPLNFNKNEVTIFGFSIAIDDLILIGLILLLLIENDCDYSLLIVLVLMLFNIDFSSLNLF